MTVESAQFADRFREIWNERNLDLADEYIAEDFVGHMIGEAEDLHGRDAYKSWVEGTHEMFPDLELAFDPVFASENVVCGQWTFTGTHEGEIPEYGIDPTGHEVEFSGLFIDRVEDGRVVEMWHMVDNLTLMQQLGVIPEEPAAAT
jgi:steroid delta-isomerase-like uncharacterized protein